MVASCNQQQLLYGNLVYILMNELLQNVYGIQFYSHIHEFDIGIADGCFFFKYLTCWGLPWWFRD